MRTDEGQSVFECKRLAGMSWNQAVKFLEKLQTKRPDGYNYYLLFKSNRQPCLVMYESLGEVYITTFENKFKTPFVKHKSTRNRV